MEFEGNEYILKKKYKAPPGVNPNFHTNKEEQRTINEKILDRLLTELYGAYNAIEMSIHSREIEETKQQSCKMDAEVQTTLKNV